MSCRKKPIDSEAAMGPELAERVLINKFVAIVVVIIVAAAAFPSIVGVTGRKINNSIANAAS